jgi:hypothetical protein
MQTTREDFEVRAEMPEPRKERGIHMPETRTLIVAAAIAGGAVAAGLVMYYYLRKRREAAIGH